ncbi:4096_t:CDS:2 [Funneliformis mosseae]|uniref:4096_t:CDS:1 n=1 Tax=Funneliformis mosseae TaxID=27381 RepID=A0A9N8ZNG2_FUNMO|nr:4096_t:CDS:2 [Funneliformis mosseae]
MSSLTPSTESTAHESTLFEVSGKEPPLSDESTDPLHSEIMAYFISRGFQSNLVRSFLEVERLNPTIFVGIEGTGVSGVTSGDDKRLLVEWGLTEETANELRNSVCEDTLWSKQILYHWLYEWILNPWDSNIQMAFDNVFYDANFPRNQWNSYDRIGHLPTLYQSAQVISKYESSLHMADKVSILEMQILYEWESYGGEDAEGSWQNVIPSAQWFEPIRHFQLAIKTVRAAKLLDNYCVGVIYFHTK